MDALKIFLRGHRVIFFQIEPFEELLLPFSNHWMVYKKFLTPYTQILNLSYSEDHLLSHMHEKCRYNIRLAQKRGVTIEQASAYRHGNIDIWMNILSDTLERDQFSGNSLEYYENFVMEIEKNNRG
jgi:lipid II:glycine glycyltransferase (peptidoglycan interpeptide bridge formation enzyme)